MVPDPDSYSVEEVSRPGPPTDSWGESSGGPRPSALHRVLRNIWDTVKVIVVSVAIIVPIRAYVAQPFFVRGASMDPTFYDREYLIICLLYTSPSPRD